MTWLTVKHSLKKAWIWVKAYWYVPLLLIAVVASYVFFRGKANGLIESFMQNREGYKTQIKKLNDLHENEIKVREGLIKKKDKKMKELENEKIKKDDQIEKEKEKRVEELKDRELGELAEKLGKEFDL